MPAHRQHKISLAELGAVYRVTRQNVGHLAKRFGWAALLDPATLFERLLSVRTSTLRTRLSCPRFRAEAAAKIKNLTAKP